MLRGSLDDFTLPDMFRLMSFAKKTGRLGVTRSAGDGKVYFRDGEVYFAESSLSKEPLGQKLVRSRALSEGQLMKALDEHKASGERLGAVLVRLGAVTPEQLETAVRQQIEDAVFDLLRWELGEFDWEPGEVLDVEIPIRVSVENLIMEASRRLDEFEVIKRKIPSGESILGMAPTPPEGAVEINITPDEWRILVLVDGERTVARIGEMVGLDEFAAMRVLYGLVSAGLIELVGESAVAEVDHPEPVATVVAEEAVVEAAPEPEPVSEHVEIEPAAPEPRAEIAEAEPVTPPDPVEAPVAEVPAEPVAEVPTEPVAEVPDEPVDQVDPGSLGEAESFGEVEAIEPEVAVDPFESFTVTDNTSVGTAEATYEPGVGEMTPEEMEAFGITPAAGTTDAWGETTAVESFDAPAPDELTTETPDRDSFVADLFADPVATPAAPDSAVDDVMSDEASGPTNAPAPPGPAPEAPAAPEEIPPTADPQSDAPMVDRAAVVRELAGLFNEDVTTRARPAAARPKPAASAGEPTKDADDGRKRVEDDDDVTKGIISRLIDGVKGL